MKRFISVLVLSIALITHEAKAQTTAAQLMGAGMPAEQAVLVAAVFTGGSVVANDTYIKSRNAAGNASISVLKVDATDDTVLNADSGDVIKLAIAGTTEATVRDDSIAFSGSAATIAGSGAIRISPEDNTIRRYNFITVTDAIHDITWGNSGTTAVQDLVVGASTSDADDDSTLYLSGGGLSSGAVVSNGTRGAYIQIPGEEVSGGSDITYNAGAGDTHIFQVAGTTAATISSLGLILSPGILNVAANVEAVAGAGSTVADAAALSATKSFHQITGANGTLGWKFPALTAGDVHFLLGTTAGVAKVYAVSGGTCNGGAADAACTFTTGILPHICYATATNALICS